MNILLSQVCGLFVQVADVSHRLTHDMRRRFYRFSLEIKQIRTSVNIYKWLNLYAMELMQTFSL